MKKTILLLILSFFISITIHAQGKSNQFAKADKLFENGELFKAIDIYKKAYSKTKKKPLKAEISFKIAECYRRMNMPKESASWYKKAISGKYSDTQAVLHYANILKMNGDFDKAKEQYQLYKELVPNDERAEIGLKSIETIKKWQDAPTAYIVTELKAFNSKQSDFCPVYSKSSYAEIYFTSTREASLGNKVNTASGQKFSSIFVATQARNGKWSEPVLLDEGVINTNFDDGTPNLNKNRVVMYFTRCAKEKGVTSGCKIYFTEKKSQIWQAPTEVKLLSDSSITVGHPAISEDELTLYFVADMEGGFGGKDLWKVTKTRKTEQWGKPENLGGQINTQGNEMFPYMRNDSTLYFSSDGHLGMGGLDIFKAVQTKGIWHVENMKVPINSEADDFGISFKDEANDAGLFSSTRNEKMSDNLFSFSLPEIKITLTGLVKDAETGLVLKGSKVSLIGSDGSSMERITADNGSFRFDLTPETDYLFTAEAQGYLKGKAEETTSGIEQSKNLNIEIMMPPIKKVFELPNIEYAYAKADLSPISMISLDNLVELLNDNPNITIELGANTDFRGTTEGNQQLSQDRAQSVVNYLISKGISDKRLSAKGYGEEHPKTIDKKTSELYTFFKEGDVLDENFINNLKTSTQKEIAHQLNRRTEFRILSTDFKD
jgi:peptidoglycan-associated lipoprotein